MLYSETGSGQYQASYGHYPQVRLKKGNLWTEPFRIDNQPHVYKLVSGFNVTDIEVEPPNPITPDDPRWDSRYWTYYTMDELMNYHQWADQLRYAYRSSPGVDNYPQSLWDTFDTYPIDERGTLTFQYSGTVYRTGYSGLGLVAQYAWMLRAKFLEKLICETDGQYEYYKRVLYICVYNMFKSVVYTKVLEDRIAPIPLGQASTESPISFNLSQLKPLTFRVRKNVSCSMSTGERTTHSFSHTYQYGDSSEVNIYDELTAFLISVNKTDLPHYAIPLFNPGKNNAYAYFARSGIDQKLKYSYSSDPFYLNGHVSGAYHTNTFTA